MAVDLMQANILFTQIIAKRKGQVQRLVPVSYTHLITINLFHSSNINNLYQFNNNNNNRINPNNQLVSRNSGQQRPNYYYTQPSEVAAPRSNSFNNTILPAQIVQNANLSDIFPFKFEANKSSFLLSNAAVNEQKAITAIPAQTVIVTADGIKKTPVEEIDNFSFTIDGIIIPVKVLVMDVPQYQALVKNDWLLKVNANLD
ncbi:hypothetical protein G9A89_004361 [Geosiphon pyriformis]|nr:hypothetical protein G9A89_004361 [Geosiphon pyriformis]